MESDCAPEGDAGNTSARVLVATPPTGAVTAAMPPPITEANVLGSIATSARASDHGAANPLGPPPGRAPNTAVGDGCAFGEGFRARSSARSSATKYASNPTSGSKHVRKTRRSRVL